jgi:ABC-type transporter Mla maintaining outer membrane lipid asymmetry permease subunit MlaE
MTICCYPGDGGAAGGAAGVGRATTNSAGRSLTVASFLPTFY